MQDVFAACALVQIIYILGDNLYVVVFLKLGDGEMSGIGLDILELSAADIIEI